jgi:hypothetical protein
MGRSEALARPAGHSAPPARGGYERLRMRCGSHHQQLDLLLRPGHMLEGLVVIGPGRLARTR